MTTGNSLTAGEEQTMEQPRRGVIRGRNFAPKVVTYSPVAGEALFEGDIILGTVDELDAAFEALGEAPDTLGASALEGIAIPGSQHRWPQGRIPFRIASNLTNQQRVTDAIAHWEQKTQIRFHQRTTEIDFVEFRVGSNCSSAVGRQGGIQFVNVGPQCRTGNIIHEIGHTVGLWHEQSREDRDQFITIDLTNVIPGTIHNFDQHITDGDDIGAYDFGSIMHYSAFAFALDETRPTIITVNGAAIGQRDGLSAGDIAAVNTIYGFV